MRVMWSNNDPWLFSWPFWKNYTNRMSRNILLCSKIFKNFICGVESCFPMIEIQAFKMNNFLLNYKSKRHWPRTSFSCPPFTDDFTRFSNYRWARFNCTCFCWNVGCSTIADFCQIWCAKFELSPWSEFLSENDVRHGVGSGWKRTVESHGTQWCHMKLAWGTWQCFWIEILTFWFLRFFEIDR